MRYVIIFFIVTVFLSSCNDRGVERLKQYADKFDIPVTILSSPVCSAPEHGVCIQ